MAKFGNSKTQTFKPTVAATSAKIATAPYNFVSLPDKPLKSEIEDVEKFKEHILQGEKFSGEIILEIETLTPIFFGGNSKDSSVTFSPTGDPIIAGSSLRGMFKNIFKIVTCGTFRGRTDSQVKGEDFNDEHIYYRCLMGVNSLFWTKDLNKEYNSRMTSIVTGADGKSYIVKNARPGFLIQTFDNKYFIAPSIYKHDLKNDRILIKEYLFATHKRNEDIQKSQIIWHDNKAYIITGTQAWSRLYDKNSYSRLTDDQKKRAGKQFIRFTKIDYVDWSSEHWRELPDEVRESYEHDRNRRGVNLLDEKNSGLLQREQLKGMVKDLPDNVKTLIPCHYLEENGQVTAFGHGQCFRIPYKNSIGDTVPPKLKSTEIVDFADAIFGREKFWASRVFFEDAVRTLNKDTLEKSAAHPLMQPNPTSYQLYLKQDDKILKHWDKVNATLRGYKLYWHNENCDWQATHDEIALDTGKPADKRLTKYLTPLCKGTKFQSKIRFQNLSAVELGALMMIFDLNGKGKTAAYKIGMGKSFGFGSIRVTPTLFIETGNTYTQLFDDGGFINPYSEKSPAEYLDAFKNFVAAQKMTATWQKIMDELNLILNWNNKPAPAKIKQMSANFSDRNNLFLQRAILPTIAEVKK